MVSPSRSASTPSPPSPDEDDIAQYDWSRAHMLDSPPRNKGKGKARERPQSDDDDDEDEDPGEDSSDSNTYPPTSDQQAETKRIEENLRRWEIAERQRRKALREGHTAAAAAAATTTTSAGVTRTPSLVSTVARGASLLWRRGGNKRDSSSYGASNKHSALHSTDNLDAFPLEDIAASPTPTPSYSPSSTPTASQRNSESTTETVTIRESNSINDTRSIPENPFDDHPPPPSPLAIKNTDDGGLISPFADSHRVSPPPPSPSSQPPQLHPPRLAPPSTQLDDDNDIINNNSTSPILTETATPFPRTNPAKRRSRLVPPPVLPLNLPTPKAPPPPPLPSVSTPPSRVSSPDPKRSAAAREDGADGDDEKPVRWWHEWLCGCSEGPDRGGEYQSGRTNPLE